MFAGMARKLPVELEGAIHHMIVLSSQRQTIFRDDRNRLAYLDRIEYCRLRYWKKHQTSRGVGLLGLDPCC
jgi:hypothetical protein